MLIVFGGENSHQYSVLELPNCRHALQTQLLVGTDRSSSARSGMCRQGAPGDERELDKVLDGLIHNICRGCRRAELSLADNCRIVMRGDSAELDKRLSPHPALGQDLKPSLSTGYELLHQDVICCLRRPENDQGLNEP